MASIQHHARPVTTPHYIELARTVISETDSRSYRLIWEANKKRFTSAGKPRSPTNRKPRTHNPDQQQASLTPGDAFLFSGRIKKCHRRS